MIPVTPEYLGKALMPGLMAITQKSFKDAILAQMEKDLDHWISQHYNTNIKATTTPEGGLVFLVKIDERFP